ncbi:ribokinase [Lederbergia galactosidilytica]|uniref:Ribokinase n=1 Tax=Lederbergia galactosidilytica TaxID=217031 RepID=A0A0Q9Y0T2_9BACI|nr:ribokinase [Lederbergia galactosidilytica]
MTQRKITIIGSMNMDMVVEAPRFPNGGETIIGNKISFIPGGKGANQAVAVARLGAPTTMIGAVGEDAFGQTLMDSLKETGVDVHYIKQSQTVSTGTASITLVPDENTIVVVPGANHELKADDIEKLESVISESDIILLQLEIPLETVEAAVDVAFKHHKTLILNPAPAQELPTELLKKIDYITPNESELETLTQMNRSEYSLDEMMDELLDKGIRCVITTLALGADGVAWKQKDEQVRQISSHQVSVVDTTGAGDAFNGALAYFLSQGNSVEQAVSFANQVSALAVTKFGAQGGMPTLEAVKEYFRE